MGGTEETRSGVKASIFLLTYDIQRCVLALSLSFLSLCFVVLCCTLTRTPRSPGVCQQSLVLAHVAPGSTDANNGERNLSLVPYD